MNNPIAAQMLFVIESQTRVAAIISRKGAEAGQPQQGKTKKEMKTNKQTNKQTNPQTNIFRKIHDESQINTQKPFATPIIIANRKNALCGNAAWVIRLVWRF